MDGDCVALRAMQDGRKEGEGLQVHAHTPAMWVTMLSEGLRDTTMVTLPTSMLLMPTIAFL